MAKKTFYQYFGQNMREMGLPAPSSLFGTLTTATATIGTMATYVKTYGTSATVAEFFATMPGGVAAAGGGAVGVAAVTSEVVLWAGGITAAFYVGACIGSLAVATGKTLSGGLSIADLFAAADRHNVPTGPWLSDVLMKNPSLLSRTRMHPGTYA